MKNIVDALYEREVNKKVKKEDDKYLMEIMKEYIARYGVEEVYNILGRSWNIQSANIRNAKDGRVYVDLLIKDLNNKLVTQSFLVGNRKDPESPLSKLEV